MRISLIQSLDPLGGTGFASRDWEHLDSLTLDLSSLGLRSWQDTNIKCIPAGL